MEITTHLQRGMCNITLRGEFTFMDHPEFREILRQLGDADLRQMTLHLAEVSFVDSAALGMLLLALEESDKHQKKLVLRGARGQVKKMFDMANFTALFDVAEAS